MKKKYSLVFKRYFESEKIHFFENDITISSFFNKIKYEDSKNQFNITIPISFWESILGQSRRLRRLFRLDMCNVFLIKDTLIVIRRRNVYRYSLKDQILIKTLVLKQCNNILHQSLCITPCNKLIFGEYGANPNRKPVNIYSSSDLGKTWKIVYAFKEKTIKHIHGCYYDKYSKKIWTLTGDFKNENFIMISDLEFKENKFIGDGSQKYRAVNLFFQKDFVHWIMDSQLEDCYHFTYDRNTKQISKGKLFPGPVWYLKQLENKYFLAASSVEKGPGVKDLNANLFLSKDLKNWTCIKSFEKDTLPMPYFKWGVIAFSDGDQKINKFSLHFEALKKVDGKSYICSIIENG